MEGLIKGPLSCYILERSENMKVKIGDTLYDSEKEPILLILSDVEKGHISSMSRFPEMVKYCSYPEDSTMMDIEVLAFMDIETFEDVPVPKEPERRFPILGGRGRTGEDIPWAALEPHREQAMRNHGQTLERLAERGGLGWSEALAVIEDRLWKNEMREEEAKLKVLQITSKKCVSCGGDLIWGDFAYNQNTCWECFKKEISVMQERIDQYPSWAWGKRSYHKEILNWMTAIVGNGSDQSLYRKEQDEKRRNRTW